MGTEGFIAGAAEEGKLNSQQNVNTAKMEEQTSVNETTDASGDTESERFESERPETGESKEPETVPGLDGLKQRARTADLHAIRMAFNKIKADPRYIAADDTTKRVMKEQSRDEVMAYRKGKGIDYQTKVDKALSKDPTSGGVTRQAYNEAMLNYAAPIPERTAAEVDAWYRQLAASSGYDRNLPMPRVTQSPKPEKKSRINELQAFRTYEADTEVNFLTDSEANDTEEVHRVERIPE
ncbi:MAG: hypothetical protein M1816_000699 [Peltula sp. TS41687]|nr:MAG: hypothetical protein M1816_000699 [Peltula sp. TS41687]